jgi:hypothetical protein
MLYINTNSQKVGITLGWAGVGVSCVNNRSRLTCIEWWWRVRGDRRGGGEGRLITSNIFILGNLERYEPSLLPVMIPIYLLSKLYISHNTTQKGKKPHVNISCWYTNARREKARFVSETIGKLKKISAKNPLKYECV